jgi:hypothetical protein
MIKAESPIRLPSISTNGPLPLGAVARSRSGTLR